MQSGQLKVVGTQAGSAVLDDRLDALGDEELLEQFLNREDGSAEEAFRALVVRHGPMVLGVCRHILTQHQDAEDAFQATFLVLARKAGSIRDRRVLARWLYEVAYRIAMRARSNGVRRRTHERQGGEMAATVSLDNHGWVELRPVLHEEVNRLPEKYRMPVILCYLEGKTNEEVAELLHWPVGTVKGRLSRARDLLRSRLTRRGLALSAAFLVTALSSGTVFADVVPPGLLEETVANGMAISTATRTGTTAAAEPDPTNMLSPDLARLMSFAAPAPVAYKLALVGVLLFAIVAALASVIFETGVLDSFATAGALLRSPGASANGNADANALGRPDPVSGSPAAGSTCASKQ